MPQVPVTVVNVTSFAVTFVGETALRDNVHTMTADDGNGVAPAAAAESEENTLTIEQLAAESGMTVRNIRSHRARGLLPAPEVRDRVGYYGSQHVARLRLIQELQSEGFNLKGIERLLEQSPGPAEQFLSFKRALGASFETEEPQAFTRRGACGPIRGRRRRGPPAGNRLGRAGPDRRRPLRGPRPVVTRRG